MSTKLTKSLLKTCSKCCKIFNACFTIDIWLRKFSLSLVSTQNMAWHEVYIATKIECANFTSVIGLFCIFEMFIYLEAVARKLNYLCQSLLFDKNEVLKSDSDTDVFLWIFITAFYRTPTNNCFCMLYLKTRSVHKAQFHLANVFSFPPQLLLYRSFLSLLQELLSVIHCP